MVLIGFVSLPKNVPPYKWDTGKCRITEQWNTGTTE